MRATPPLALRRVTAGPALAALLACACTSGGDDFDCSGGPPPVQPRLVTPPVPGDADDPALWIDPVDRSRSLVLGTDKDAGSLFAYDLDGDVVGEVPGLAGPNNVDVEYGLELAATAPRGERITRLPRGGERSELLAGPSTVDVAVVTERRADRIRVFSLPDLTPIDGGGIDVFVGESERQPMGIALYRRPSDGAVFAIVSRKSGPKQGYLFQYLLEGDGSGGVTGTKVREFGAFSGSGEIEAVAVDDALGYVYYSDEREGVRKYAADPDAPDADVELALFGTEGFAQDREGISIYAIDDGTGYVIVSDQQCHRMQVFPREGSGGDPHAHPLLATIPVAARASDGNEVTSAVLGSAFPEGLFVAMSNDRTFHYYAWPDFAGTTLVVAPDGDPGATR